MPDNFQTEDSDFAAELEREYKRLGDEMTRPGRKIEMLTDIFSNEDLLRFVSRLLAKDGSLSRARATVNAILSNPERCPSSISEKYDLTDLRILHPQFLSSIGANLRLQASRPDCPQLYKVALEKMAERSEKAKRQYANRTGNKNKKGETK